ncbi:MAG: MFS transporter [Clostridia bacterium]
MKKKQIDVNAGGAVAASTYVCRPEDKVPLKEQILYGASDIFGGGQAAFLSVILLAFFTNIVGIEAGIAGTIITVSKLWDAISDPGMGLISENSRWSKLGRRKPFMIIGGILIPFGLAFLFAPIGVSGLNLGATSKIVWMVFAYIAYCTISTVSQVPFMSMASDISMDYKERNKANTWKLIFDIASSAILYVVPALLWGMVTRTNNPIPYEQFYYVIVFGFGLLFAIPLIVGGLTIKERAPYDMHVKAHFSFKEYFRGLSVKSYIFHILMYVCAFLTMDIVSALAIYYTDYIGGHAFGVMIDLGFMKINMGSIMIIAPMMICAGAGILIAYAIKAKYNKQAAYRTLLPFYIIGALLLAIYQPSWNMPYLVPIFAAIMGFGFAGPQSMPWLVFPDTVDVAELKLGYRPTANMSAVMTFTRKVATAFGVGMVGWVLGGAGFIPSPTPETFATQPDSVFIAIRVLLFVSVFVLLTVGYIASMKYKVTNKKLDRIRYFNEKRNASGVESFNLAEQVEFEQLKKELC